MNALRALAPAGPGAVFSLDLPLDLEFKKNLKEFQKSLEIPTAEKIAQLRQLDFDELAQATSANTIRLFNLPETL